MDDLAGRYWASVQAGDYAPDWLVGRLDLDAALGLQLAVLEGRRCEGFHLGGFKVGLTSERARKLLGAAVQPFGFILAERVLASGAVVEAKAMRRGAVEPELCWTVGERLSGPISPSDVPKAMVRVAAGFELNEQRPGSVRPDFPMTVAAGLAQWAIVEGEGLELTGSGLDVNAVECAMSCNGDERYRGVSRDELDDHFLSLSRLSEILGRHGQALEPGHKVITGAFARFDAHAGEHWRADYSGLGAVEVHFD